MGGMCLILLIVPACVTDSSSPQRNELLDEHSVEGEVLPVITPRLTDKELTSQHAVMEQSQSQQE